MNGDTLPSWDETEELPNVMEASEVVQPTEVEAIQELPAELPAWDDTDETITMSPNEDAQEFLDSSIPATLQFAGFDTGWEIYPEVSAGIASMGYHMLDVYRGTKQILGVDKEELAHDRDLVNKLFADERYGSFATAGGIAGALAEPLGFLIPAVKSKSIFQAAKVGVATGATFGTLGYVDESQNETRIGNAMIGALLGGTVGTLIKTVPKVWRATTKVPAEKIRARQANRVLDNYEVEWAKQIAAGKTPKEARETLLAMDSKLGTKVKKAFTETKRLPHTAVSQTEAQQIVDLQQQVKKPIDIALGTVSDIKDSTMKGIDTIGGVMSTRVKNISEPVFHRLRTYEYNIRNRSHQLISRADDFTDRLSTLSENQQLRVHSSLLNGDYKSVKSIYKNAFGDEGELAVDEVASVLEDLGKDLYQYNRIQGRIKNYFPRYISDKKGMLAALNKEDFRNIRDEMGKAASKKGSALTPSEESDIINKRILRPVKPGEGGPGLTKKRSFETVPSEFQQYYSKPSEALNSYISNAVMDIEKAKFFGKGYKKSSDNYIDLRESVGGFLRDEIKSGEISTSQFNELSELLNVRFGVGESSAVKVIQDAKNVMYASLLGNPISAATQLGDVGVSIYMNGFKNTLSAVSETLTKKTQVTVKDFGLIDKLSEEFASTRKSAQVLNKALRYGAFESVDRLGKSTVLNSSLKKYQKIADPTSGLSDKARVKALEQFELKYKGVFGDEFQNLVNDLKNKKVTENVKLMLFNELSDVQPISLSEMPQKYLELPNGRVMYMFKTFLLKQLDIVRRDSYNQIKSGNRAEGFYNLAKYGAIIGTANTGSQYIKDWMMGRDVEANLPEDIPKNLIKTLGWSEYTQSQLEKGKVSEAAIDFITPPVNIFDKIIQDPEKAVQFMPIVGRLYYNWFGGGIEEWQEKQEKKEGGSMFTEQSKSSMLFSGE